MTREEQETIIRWDEDEQVAHCYTCSPRIHRLWLKRGYSIESDPNKDGGWRTRLPFKLIRWGKPQTESQRAASLRNAAKLGRSGDKVPRSGRGDGSKAADALS